MTQAVATQCNARGLAMLLEAVLNSGHADRLSSTVQKQMVAGLSPAAIWLSVINEGVDVLCSNGFGSFVVNGVNEDVQVGDFVLQSAGLAKTTFRPGWWRPGGRTGLGR
jgi:hypothetical protein